MIVCLALVLSAATPTSDQVLPIVALDPPAKAPALAPNMSVLDGILTLSWIETAPGSNRLRTAQLSRGKWTPAETIASSEKIVASSADLPTVTRRAGGARLAHWAAKSGATPYAYDVQMAQAKDARWKTLGAANDDGTATEHGFVSVVPENKSFRAFWLDGRELAKSPPGSMTLRSAPVDERGLGPVEVLDPRVCECCGTSAGLTSKGPIIAYRDRDDKDVRNIAVIRQVDGRWLAPKAVHDDQWIIAGCPVNGPALDAQQETVAVAWFTGAGGGEVRFARSIDAGDTFAVPARIDTGSPPLGRVDVVLLEGGDAAVSWLATQGDEAVLWVRRATVDGRLGSPRRVMSIAASRGSGFPRMARLGSEIVFAWTDASSQIRVAKVSASALPGPMSAAADTPNDGEAAVEYAATTLDGAPVSLAALRGKVVLLNVWATWCRPCRAELPELSKLHRELNRRGLAVVAVSVDERSADAAVRDMLAQAEREYGQWRDPDDQVTRRFGISALPATLLFTRQGRLAWRRVGTITADDPELRGVLTRELSTGGVTSVTEPVTGPQFQPQDLR